MDTPTIGLIGFAAIIVVVAVIIVISRRRLVVQKDEGTEAPKDALPSIDFTQGDPGEQMLASIIEKMNIGKSKIYRGVYIPREDGTTTFLKLVMLNASGIYVFKYIALEGWILGREESRWWTHFISTEERDFINNPIWENDGAVTDLMNFFPKTLLSQYHSYVVFSDKCELRSVEVTGNTRVVNVKDFERLLERDMLSTEPVFDLDEMRQLEKVLDVLDKSDELEVRLQELKKEMELDQLEKATEEKERLTAEEIKGDIPAGMTEEEKREELRAARHIRKYRPEDRFTRSELALRDALVIWRKQQADAQKISVFEIFDNRALDGIVNLKPQNLKELRTVPGFDTERCNNFGNAIVTMVRHAPQ
jgi:hypothetical protein